MKSIIALGVGLVVALAPGTAFAAPAEFGTGLGNAYGNCQHSSATGTHAPLPESVGNGNGGWVTVAKARTDLTKPCAVTTDDGTSGTPVLEEPADGYDAGGDPEAGSF